MKKRLLIFFLVIAQVAIGQRYSFVSFSTPEGLPQSQVNTITQDSLGYLWIGTFGGVSKFNGKSFINYSKSDGLLNNRVTYAAYIDSLMYLGHDNGISFQYKKDSFASVELPNAEDIANISGIIRFNKVVYVTTNGAGMYQLNKEKNELIRIENSPVRIRGVDRVSDELLLATREGIYRFNSKEGFSIHPAFPEESYSDINHFDKKLYATTFFGQLWKLKSNQAQAKEVYYSEKHRFRKVFVEGENKVWLNAKAGVIRVDQEKKTLDLNESSGLPIDDINIIFKDRESNIWLGSGGKGLLKFSGERFTHFNKKNELPSELIISALEDELGNLWLSSFDKGLFIIDAKGNVINENVDYLTSTVWSSIRLNGELLFGSLFGLHKFNGNNWKSYYTEDGLPANKITGLQYSKHGDVFIGTAEGVAIYNSKEGIRPFQGIDDPVKNVRAFVERGDTVFLAAQSGLFKCYNQKLTLIKRFEGGVNSLAIDSTDRVWVGTESGLFTLHKDIVEPFDLSGKSGADYINFLIENKNVIYVGTNYGLYSVTINDNIVQHFGINAGLVDLETNLNSAITDSEGQLWFGTVAGLMRMDFNNELERATKAFPKLHLLEISVNFEKYRPESLNKKQLFAHKQNNLSFVYDGVYLSEPENISYTYQLEGFSDKWSPNLQNNTISFTNLPPGEYTLKVRAVVDNQLKSSIHSFSFRITPPFYKTWWFYTLVSISIIIILIALDRMRTRKIEQKNYQQNLEVKSKLAQLEQQSLNASMNRHFIFNSLNSIQYYINASDNRSANRYLTRFAKLIRKNLDSSHGKNGMVSLSDELERLELYLELESMRFNKKFNFSIKVEENVEPELLLVPAMFLQPFVENSIIHGILPMKGKEGTLKISVTDHFDHIRIEIFDNGVGIDNSLKRKKEGLGDHQSQGVEITKGRIELLQKISARSIELVGPHQINERDSSVKGTLVIFKILKQFLEKQ